ncbi:MAG: class I SAM-dependent methyltransferase [Solirubrobacteraceae bacterium]
MARAVGRPLEPGARVLDFGAGAGRHVAEFRAAGYDALGVDQDFTAHEQGSAELEYLRRIDPPAYELPFDANEFDFVYSFAVMEHVLDPASALAEVSRVLRHDGLSIHLFASRWRPVETHMKVPFGGRFQCFALMQLWARLGIRNSFQKGLPATDVALRNTQYCKTGISYPTAWEWELRAGARFANVSWAERHYVDATRDVKLSSRLVAPVIHRAAVERAYRGLHVRALVLAP